MIRNIGLFQNLLKIQHLPEKQMFQKGNNLGTAFRC